MYLKASLLISALAVASKADDFLNGEPNKHGLVDIPKGNDMFYWLFPSRRDAEKDPLVLWLTGGPGCASELATFYENGPVWIKDDMSFERNQLSWNNHANVLYVDNPIGTGYSKIAGWDYDQNEDQISKQMHTFLLGFLEQNPEYKGREFYITGESYAGHYIPSISYYLVFNQTDVELNFKGSAIGNGWVDPYDQYPQYAEFAYDNHLINTTDYLMLTAAFGVCQSLIDSKSYFYAMELCQLSVEYVLGYPWAPAFNVYDIRIPCAEPPLCYNMTAATVFLNRDDVREKLGVPGREWEQCAWDVHTAMLGDWIVNMKSKVGAILDAGLDVLVYSGDKDYVCNWYGGRSWTAKTDWKGKEEFNAAEFKEWSVDGEAAGQLRSHENFKFLRVYNAGHMVPKDQPKNAVAMLEAFILNAEEKKYENILE